MKIGKSVGALTCAVTFLLVGPFVLSGAVDRANPAAGPTVENALAAEHEVARALLANDAEAVGRLLADDWAVVSTYGGVANRADFLAAIESGNFTRKSLDLSDARVRVYGNTAVVTSRLQTSGTLGGKPFDIAERQTDVLVWSEGGWKSVLTHETQIRSR